MRDATFSRRDMLRARGALAVGAAELADEIRHNSLKKRSLE
jgi:hypothetical protein